MYAEVDDEHTIKKMGIKPLSGKNPWPSDQFKQIYLDYIDDLKRIGLATMRAIAMGLGLNEFYFDDYMKDPFWVTR